MFTRIAKARARPWTNRLRLGAPLRMLSCPPPTLSVPLPPSLSLFLFPSDRCLCAHASYVVCSVVHDASVFCQVPAPPACQHLAQRFSLDLLLPLHDGMMQPRWLAGWLCAVGAPPEPPPVPGQGAPSTRAHGPAWRSTKIAGLSSRTLNWPNPGQPAQLLPTLARLPSLPSLRAQATRQPTQSQTDKESSLAESCM